MIGKSKADTGSSATAGDANVVREQVAFIEALVDILVLMDAPTDILKFLRKVAKMNNDQRLTACARRL